MNSRVAIERQWAGLAVRQPAVRHVLLKWLRAYGIDGSAVHFTDPLAGAIYRAVMFHVYSNEPVTSASIGAEIARRDFTRTVDESIAAVTACVAAVPTDVDVERLALAVLTAMRIVLPVHEVTEYLIDPLGLRAAKMTARKAKWTR